MYWAVLFCVLGMASSQMLHGHNLRELVDKGFERLDHNPKDGLVTLSEYADRYFQNDIDHDKCVTMQEFQGTHPYMSAEVSTKMYNHFDLNHNQCVGMDDILEEFHLIDHNHNGELTLHEFEQYMTHMINKLFGQG